MASSTDKRLINLESATERKHEPFIILLPVGARAVALNETVEFEFEGGWRPASNLNAAAEIVRENSKSMVETIPYRALNQRTW